ncbi:MAG: hypothetical protein EXR27_20910 [Betaproteobacteria bacterium]|nr:hypothetical protein [Betaproteobacteria bacterium]
MRLADDLSFDYAFAVEHHFSPQESRGLIFAGSPNTVARRLHDAAAEGLFDTFLGEFNIGWLEEEALMRSIRLFGDQVIPSLRNFEPY